MKVHYLSICVCGKADQSYSIVFNVQNICFLISACHLTFTIIFYYHVVMNTFIQWQETISDAYLTYTPSYFPFIEPNTSLLPEGSLASIPSNALILNTKPLPCSHGAHTFSCELRQLSQYRVQVQRVLLTLTVCNFLLARLPRLAGSAS